MPGPGGGGFGGPGGGPGGGFGGPGGPGGFRGPGGFGGPGWGGGPPGFWGPIAWGGPPLGPCGLPCFCWPILVLLVPYIIIVSIGIVLLQSLAVCSSSDADDDGYDGYDDDSTLSSSTTEFEYCAEFEFLWAIGLAVVMLLCFCLCFCRLRDKARDGTRAEQAPILTATQVPPPVETHPYASAPPLEEGAFPARAYVEKRL